MSTEKQAREAQTSIADQRKQIGALAARFGFGVDRWYLDEGASGATVAARPAFSALLEDCAAMPRSARDPGLVLVLDDSRFGRFDDPDEAAYWRHHLRRLGWVVRFCVGDETEDVGYRHIMRAIGGAASTEERQKIRRRARQGIRGASELGYWTREAPFGFRRQVVYPKPDGRVLERGQLKAPNEKVKLTPDEDEAALVRWMFEAYVSGEHSLTSIGEQAAALYPERNWTPGAILKVLKMEVYMGDVVGGLRRRDAGPDRYVCRDAHPAIVSRPTFERAQQQLVVNRGRGRAVRSFYLLSGVLTCPHCGEPYTGGGTTGRRPGKDPRFYRDRGGVRGICDGPIGCVTCSFVDVPVIREIGRLVRSRAGQRAIAEELDRALEGAGSEASRQALRTRLRRAEQQRERLARAIAEGVLTSTEAAAQMARLRSHIEEAEAALHAAQFAGRRLDTARSERDQWLDMLREFPARAARLSGPALRELVVPWIGLAEFDKTTRVLKLGLHRLPAIPHLLPLHRAGPTSGEQVAARLWLREIRVGRVA